MSSRQQTVEVNYDTNQEVLISNTRWLWTFHYSILYSKVNSKDGEKTKRAYIFGQEYNILNDYCDGWFLLQNLCWGAPSRLLVMDNILFVDSPICFWENSNTIWESENTRSPRDAMHISRNQITCRIGHMFWCNPRFLYIWKLCKVIRSDDEEGLSPLNLVSSSIKCWFWTRKRWTNLFVLWESTIISLGKQGPLWEVSSIVHKLKANLAHVKQRSGLRSALPTCILCFNEIIIH